MSIIHKLLLGVVSLLLVACCGLVLALSVQTKRLDSASSAAATASADSAAHKTAATEVVTIYKDKEKANAALDNAIRSNPEWSNQPVPDAVLDLLRHDSGSTRAVP